MATRESVADSSWMRPVASTVLTTGGSVIWRAAVTSSLVSSARSSDLAALATCPARARRRTLKADKPRRALLAPSRTHGNHVGAIAQPWSPATPSSPAAASPAGLTPFESYYRKQRIVPDEEWPAFAAALQSPLPLDVRVSHQASRAFKRLLALLPDANERPLRAPASGSSIAPLRMGTTFRPCTLLPVAFCRQRRRINYLCTQN